MNTKTDPGDLQVEAQPGVITIRIAQGSDVAEADLPNAEMAATFIDGFLLALSKAWPEVFKFRRSAQ